MSRHSLTGRTIKRLGIKGWMLLCERWLVWMFAFISCLLTSVQRSSAFMRWTLFIHSFCKDQHQAVGFNITADKGRPSRLMRRHVLLSQSSVLQHNLQHETPLGCQPQLRQAEGLSLWDGWRKPRQKKKKKSYLLSIHCRCGWCLKELWLKENISVLVRTLSPLYVKAYSSFGASCNTLWSYVPTDSMDTHW